MASPSSNHHNASNRACNVLPGSILWLQSKSKCDATTLPLNPDLDDGCYDHPVLILRADSKQAQASILLLTSLRNQGLVEKYPDNAYFRHLHLPIFPCAAHPDHGTQLFLADGLRLRRDSYVKTEWRYAVPWEFLAAYDDSGRSFALHSVSYRDLMAYLRTPFVHASPPPSRLDIDDDGVSADSGLGTRGRGVAGFDADKVNTTEHAYRVKSHEADNNKSNAAGFLASFSAYSLSGMLISSRRFDGRISACLDFGIFGISVLYFVP